MTHAEYLGQLNKHNMLSGWTSQDYEDNRIKLINENVNMSHATRFLDFHCGYGTTLAKLSIQYPQTEFWGFEDYPQCALHIMRYRHTYIYALEQKMLPKDHFDAVYMNGILHHYHEQIELILINAYEWLKKDGLLIICENNANHPIMRAVMNLNPVDKGTKPMSVKQLTDKLHMYKILKTIHYKALPKWLKIETDLPIGTQYMIIAQK